MKIESLVDLCANVLCIYPEYVDMCLIPSELSQALWKKRYSHRRRCSHRRGEEWCWIFPYHIKEPVEWDPLEIVAKRVGLLLENYNTSFFSDKERNQAGEKMMDYISTNARFITSKHFCLYYIKQRILSFLAYVDDEKANQTWRNLFKEDIPGPMRIVQIVLCGKNIGNLSIHERREAIKTLLQMLHRHGDLVEIKVDAISDKDVLGDMVRAYVKEFHFTVPNNPLGPYVFTKRTSSPHRGYGHIPHPRRTGYTIIWHGSLYEQYISDGWSYYEDSRIWTPPEEEG